MNANKKLMDTIAKSIEEKINSRYANGTAEEIRTYNVNVEMDYKTGSILVTPKNGTTFHCMEKLMLIAEFYNVSKLVSIYGGVLTFNMFGIYKF